MTNPRLAFPTQLRITTDNLIDVVERVEGALPVPIYIEEWLRDWVICESTQVPRHEPSRLSNDTGGGVSVYSGAVVCGEEILALLLFYFLPPKQVGEG